GGAGREGRAAARLTAGAAHPPRGREATRPAGASTTKGNPMRQIILTVTREERVIQQFAFAARTVTIGRVVENDVVLDHPNVSRMHAEISAEDGKLFVDDLGSANGTLLNGRRVDRAEVRHRDVLAIGPFK